LYGIIVADGDAYSLSARNGLATELRYSNASYAWHEEQAMNTTAADNVITELSDDCQPAEILLAWAERAPDLD
jgi:hypothetical protein